MKSNGPAFRVLRMPLADLERTLIETFLHARGLDGAARATLSQAAQDAVLKEASLYASSKLAEIEARSHYVDEMHHQE